MISGVQWRVNGETTTENEKKHYQRTERDRVGQGGTGRDKRTLCGLESLTKENLTFSEDMTIGIRVNCCHALFTPLTEVERSTDGYLYSGLV